MMQYAAFFGRAIRVKDTLKANKKKAMALS